MSSDCTLGILGGGRAAWAFGSAWRRIGWPVAGVWLRQESTSRIADLLSAPRRSIDDLAREADVLLLAVSDRAIDAVAALVPATNAVIFHASGVHVHVRGGFSLHPLKALPPVGHPSDLRDTLLVFEGNHAELAKRIADAVGARFAEIDAAQKPLYHAAAVFGANYVAAVVDVTARLMSEAGVGEARDDLVALARSAIDNWRAHDDAGRFTGPAARGDTATIERHLEALAGHPELQRLYRLLADEIAGAILARRP
jgi:predicted short-subunit dehydrogenase-like oxidoreductase (DUF2520 family)